MSQALEFPRGHFSVDDLSNTLALVSASAIFVGWGTIVGGAARETVIFRRPDAGATYFEQLVPINGVIDLHGMYFPDGLEVITADGAGDIGVVLHYAV